MACCIIIAVILALLTRLLAMRRANALAWRPVATIVKDETAPRTGGRVQSVIHALRGLSFLARHEPNMRLHLGVAAIVSLAGLQLGLSLTEWQWIVLAIALVLMAETLNTAVEQTCNAISREFHPAIKAAKDVAASAVLISAIAAALIGAFVFVPHVMAMASGPPAFTCLAIK